MKKIICNDCCGAWIYKYVLKETYSTPFIWSRIHYDEFFELIKNFDKILFNEFILEKDDDELKTFNINVSNIHLHYIHYIFDSNCNELQKKNGEVRYNKIWEYVVDKYTERLDKMLTNTEKPIFIFHCDKNYIKLFGRYDYIFKIIEYVKINNINLLLLSDMEFSNLPTNIKYIHFNEKDFVKDILNNSIKIKEFINNF